MTFRFDVATRRALLIITGATCWRLAFIGWFSAGPDEASYWDWSRHLDFGYVDHPPLIAYVMFGLRAAFGDRVVCWRLLAVLLAAVNGWLLYSTGRRLYSPGAGLWALAAHSVSPVFSMAAASLVLPETLLAFWTSLSVYLAARLLSAPKLRFFCLLGLSMGCGLLSKWPAASMPAAMLLFAVLSPDHRAWLRRPAFMLMLLIPVVLLVPVIFWNIRHDWASWAFARSRTSSSGPASFEWQRVWEAILGQAAYHSPLLAVACWWAVLRAAWLGLRRRQVQALLLFCFSGPMLIGFMAAAGWRTTLPHWAASAYLPAFVALGGLWQEVTVSGSAWRRLARGATIAIGGLVCILGPAIMFFPLTTMLLDRLRPVIGLHQPVIEPMAHAVGWNAEIRDGLARIVRRVERENGQVPIVLTPLHTLTGMLAFHLRDVCQVLSLHCWAHQYDQWYSDQALQGRPVLYVNSTAFFLPAGGGQPQDYYKFDDCRREEDIPVMRSAVQINVIQVWKCSGYRGPATDP